MRRLSTPLEAKNTASTAPNVSTPRCEAVSTLWISSMIGLAISSGQVASRNFATSSARLRKSKSSANDVSTMKNGNIAMRTDNAMWLAIAQASSSLK